MNLVVYIDCPFWVQDGAVSAELSFLDFVSALARELGGLRLLGRLDPCPGVAHHTLDPAIGFVALPHYDRLTRFAAVGRSVPGTVKRMWRALDDADTVFSLGPHPHAIALALIALVRRRRLVLGVRQHFPAYVRHRRPRNRVVQLAAWVLESVWRALSIASPVVAVGPDIARRYRHAPRLLDVTISLVTAADVAAGAEAAHRSYAGDQLTLLTVGRIDAEKNPLLLADVLALLRQHDPRWRLLVCGEGDLAGELSACLQRLGLSDYCQLRGYVPLDRGLLELYRQSHVFLHVSRTEGLPQVLIEAYASGLPSVATAVGGVRSLGDSSVLVQPGDAAAAAAAVERIAGDGGMRRRLVAAGLNRARQATIEVQAGKLARFISG